MTNIIDKLREAQYPLGAGTRDQAARALRWQAAWDWAGETVLTNASQSLHNAAEETDRVLRRYGIKESSNSVGLKQYTVELDASGRNTTKLTRAGLDAWRDDASRTATGAPLWRGKPT